MDYEIKARELLAADFQAETLVDFRRDKAAKWLRKFAARVLREEAAAILAALDANSEGIGMCITHYLERRAKAIEGGE